MPNESSRSDLSKSVEFFEKSRASKMLERFEDFQFSNFRIYFREVDLTIDRNIEIQRKVAQNEGLNLGSSSAENQELCSKNRNIENSS